MALKRVKGSIDRIFDKSLQDLVRGIRNHKSNEAHYVSLCVDEIKVELKQENVAVKANAVNKLIYLQMLGYDISWAAFNIIEVMSSPKFTFKRIGYLAASQCFHSETDVLMLTTNMIRKDLGSQNFFDAGIALNGLSCFITPDLARDLANDILALMTSSRPYTRKRAVLISYKIFLCYPEALRPAFPRLKEKLEDPDPGVQSAAVNVICELARKNPKNYLSLAPVFFKLMTSSTNNWVLIKIIKLFGALTPLEPRLGKKLIEPLTNLIHNTSAMSLLYECINTVVQVLISFTSGMQDHGSSIQLCVQKLRILIEDSDQNLKYLGLLAMSRILKTHPKAVQAHKDLILQCLDDKDESIRLRALDLLFGMVSKKNLMEIVKKLMIHVAKADGSQYRDELISKIIEICCQNNFQYITNFEWYISVLIELTRIDGSSSHGGLISSQILDVAIRVKSIRQFAAHQMATLLENAHALMSQLHRNGMEEVLYAAAYICGEFAQFVESPDCLIHAMVRPRATTLPSHIQGVYLHNIMKLYAVALKRAEDTDDKGVGLTQSLQEKLPIFIQSSNLEVQERASCILTLLKYIEKLQNKGLFEVDEFSCLFKGELNPVAPKAQRKVPVPEGLDLDAWINDPPSSSEDEDAKEEQKMEYERSYNDFYSPTSEKRREYSQEELNKLREERMVEQANNPNYLMSKKAEGYMNPDEESEAGSINLDISVPLHVPGLPSSDRYFKMEQDRRRRQRAERVVKKKKAKRGKHGRKREEQEEPEEEEDIAPVHAVEIVNEEMPEGAVKTDSEDENPSFDPHKALDIDLDSPLTASEALPKPKHRESAKLIIQEPEKKEKPSKKKKHKKEKKHKKKHHSAPVESLLVDEVDVDRTVNGHQHQHVDQQDAVQVKKEKKEDDLSFWLNDSSEKVEEPVVNGVAVEDDKATQKSSKEKKRNKKAKKSKRKSPEVGETPPPSEPQIQMSRYTVLAENKDMRIEFETRCIPRQEKKITVSCVFSNLSSSFIKTIEFNVLDTLNTRLIRDGGNLSHDAVQIPFSLPPSARNECQLEFTASSVTMPQRLKGTITYMVQDDTKQHTNQEKLDFKLHLPCSAYLMSTPLSSDRFTKLLSSGEVTDKASYQFNNTDMSLESMLQKLCFYIKFAVVEQIGNSASLYSSSIQKHHVCLLVKSVGNGISIDGKSDNSSLLSNIMDEVKMVGKT
ncbi:AP-3 complex subunit delta-1 isoform X1 [Ciona intestinalis]